MKVLVVTNMYPTPALPHFGVFVKDQVESLRREGIDIDVFFIDGRRNKLNYVLGLPRLWNHLRTHRYDLLHAHYVFAGVIARAQWQRPVVLTHHGPEVFMTWQAYLSRLVTPWFHSVIVVSPEMKAKLRAKDAHVIPCGIDMERFQPMPMDEARRQLDLPANRRLVLWAGEYYRPEKRFDVVEKAMALLRAEDAAVELVLVSGKPHSVVSLYMNACDVLVLTSDAEGSPMVIKEAMACNQPIVSTPVGDVREVIGGIEGCFLCTQDPADVAEKLRLALRWGRRTDGRDRIWPLELGRISRRIIAVYEQTLAASRRAASVSESP